VCPRRRGWRRQPRRRRRRRERQTSRWGRHPPRPGGDGGAGRGGPRTACWGGAHRQRADGGSGNGGGEVATAGHRVPPRATLTRCLRRLGCAWLAARAQRWSRPACQVAICGRRSGRRGARWARPNRRPPPHVKVGMSVKSIGKRNRLPSVYRSVSVTKSVGKPGKINTRIIHPQSGQLCYVFLCGDNRVTR